MYKEKSTSRSEFVPIRSLCYHVRIWQGNSVSSTLPPLVLVHGWMDVAASYQFMVDALTDAFAAGRTIIAPDWRGFGLTNGAADNYWLPDYLADLDFLLDHYVKECSAPPAPPIRHGRVAAAPDTLSLPTPRRARS